MAKRVGVVVLVAAIVTAVVALLAGRDGGGEPDGAAVVGEFLAAYERSRTETFVVEQTFTRTAPDGRTISYPRRLVQRPPDDRLLVGGGSAEGRLDGRVVRCSTSPGGTSRCDEGPEAEPYDQEVAAEVDALRALVDGPAAPYEVRAGEPGCWSLHLRRAVLTPPYGDAAGFCFDPATGAPTRLEIRRAEATDVIEAVDIRTVVTADDLRPGDLGELPGT